jgi:tRNA threonylcarbamoyladenosine biosynthesis protein TsaB
MKAYTIALEGSTYRGSVALLRDSEVVAERTLGGEAGGGKREAGRGDALMPAIAECLKETGIKREEIARIVCGSGPGSFTSLRIAGSVGKGLAVGYGVDLYAVSSLLLTVTGAGPDLPPGEYLSVLDAMRGEFYGARFTLRPDHTAVGTAATGLFTADELTALSERESGTRVIGPGQRLDFHPRAEGVAPMLDSIVGDGPVDLALWEPDYGRLAEAQVRWEAEHGRALPR